MSASIWDIYLSMYLDISNGNKAYTFGSIISGHLVYRQGCTKHLHGNKMYQWDGIQMQAVCLPLHGD